MTVGLKRATLYGAYIKGAHFFQKCAIHLKNIGCGKVTSIRFLSEDPQILGATVQNLIATTTRHPELVNPWPYMLCYALKRPSIPMDHELFRRLADRRHGQEAVLAWKSDDNIVKAFSAGVRYPVRHLCVFGNSSVAVVQPLWRITLPDRNWISWDCGTAAYRLSYCSKPVSSSVQFGQTASGCDSVTTYIKE